MQLLATKDFSADLNGRVFVKKKGQVFETPKTEASELIRRGVAKEKAGRK